MRLTVFSVRHRNQLSDGRTYVDRANRMREGKQIRWTDPHCMTDLCRVTDSVGSMGCHGHVVDDPGAGWATCQVGKALVERTPEEEFDGKALGIECGP